MREILALSLRTFVVAALLTGSGFAYAVSEFVEGTHYQRLPIEVDVQDPAKIEVVEVFSYMCNHCYNFDPYVEAWKVRQPEDVLFRRVPASFNNDYELMAQAFYTADALGVGEQVHTPIFNGLHTQGVDLRRVDNLAVVFENEADVEREAFDGAYGSFSVRGKVQQSKALTRAYRITGVPSLVVAGKYLIDGQMAGGNAKMLEVADYLVSEERALKSKAD